MKYLIKDYVGLQTPSFRSDPASFRYVLDSELGQYYLRRTNLSEEEIARLLKGEIVYTSFGSVRILEGK